MPLLPRRGLRRPFHKTVLTLCNLVLASCAALPQAIPPDLLVRDSIPNSAGIKTAADLEAFALAEGKVIVTCQARNAALVDYIQKGPRR